nr:class B sortase [uncultured Acetatifactor sp.]
MGKGIRRAVTAAAFVLFVFSAATAGSILYERYRDRALYQEAQDSYVSFREESGEAEGEGTERTGNAPEEGGLSGGIQPYREGEAGKERAPLVVDFAALREENEDIEGWLYCEGTPINYPVVRGEDNSFYLDHSYDGKASSSGAIFLDAANESGFADANSILYGHHMKNGSMFACLEKWSDQEFYEEHPEMWLLTPEGDYRIVLFAGYTTAADSETYMIFTDSCGELEAYLKACAEKSDFQVEAAGEAGRQVTTVGSPGAEPETAARAGYVVLSTCAYSFEEARYVLHGVLVPVERQEDS